MVKVAAGSGMWKSCAITRGAAALMALNSCNSFCSLVFSSVKVSQHCLSSSQSTSVCFSFVLHTKKNKAISIWEWMILISVSQVFLASKAKRFVKVCNMRLNNNRHNQTRRHYITNAPLRYNSLKRHEITESHTLLSCFGTRLPLDEVASSAVWLVRSFASVEEIVQKV